MFTYAKTDLANGFTDVPIFVYIERTSVYNSRGNCADSLCHGSQRRLANVAKGRKMPDFHLLAAAASETLQNVSTLDPVSPPAESIRFLMIFVTAVTLGILAIVWGVLFYSLFRFRRKKSADDRIETEPPQVYGSLPIEIAWTVAPALIVL